MRGEVPGHDREQGVAGDADDREEGNGVDAAKAGPRHEKNTAKADTNRDHAIPADMFAE